MIHWKGHLGAELEKWNINGRQEDHLGSHYLISFVIIVIVQVSDEGLNSSSCKEQRGRDN